MSAVAVPVVRAAISHVRLPLARRFAKRVMVANTVADVRTLLIQRYKRRGMSALHATSQLGPYRDGRQERYG
ncbi:unnamed protein product [marine sediment metagenome]|uniref:Uncharacterized protein n=1 Tax=marine sediment metagenome TaxID=412755 RepID=X0YSS4_9ZZZZ